MKSQDGADDKRLKEERFFVGFQPRAMEAAMDAAMGSLEPEAIAELW